MNNINILRDIIFPFVNFGLLVFLLYKLLREPIKTFFHKRSHQISKEIEDEKTSKDQIEANYHELMTKLNAVDAEIKRIKTNIIEIAEAESKKIHLEGQKLSSKISEDAKQTADYHISKTKLAIQEEIYQNAEKKAIQQLNERLNDKNNQELIVKLLQKK